MESWRKTLDLNVMGIIRGVNAFLPTMPDGGSISITASMMGLVYPGYMATYNASKAAAVAIAETLRWELRHRSISVTAICPQFFRTGLRESLSRDDALANHLANILMGQTWLQVDPVADRSLKAIDAGRIICTPDAVAAISWYAKRFLPPAYRWTQLGVFGLLRKLALRKFPEEKAAVHGPPARARGDFSQPVALVTGAASGLGLALTERFVREGFRVVALDLRDDVPRELHELGSAVEYRKLDVSSVEEWDALAADLGPLDVVAMNAGVAGPGRIGHIPDEAWERVFAVNVMGVALGLRATVPLLRDKGRILVTSSAAAMAPPATMGAYSASKAAAAAIAESCHWELRYRGISATAVCPQYFSSNFAQSLPGDDPGCDDIERELLGRTKLTPEKVADAAVRGALKRKMVVAPDLATKAILAGTRLARPAYIRVQEAPAAKARKRLGT